MNDFQQIKDFVSKCIKSCETATSNWVAEHMILTYIVERFKDIADAAEITYAAGELAEQIEEVKHTISITPTK